MPDKPELNLPPIKMRLKREGDDLYVWDVLRRKYLLLTPEERVRRYMLDFLTSYCRIPAQSLVQEFPVPLNGTAQRADIVAVGTDGKPFLLVECKAPDVAIDKDVLAQATRYNTVVNARYVILTNGLRHYCYERTADGYRTLSEFPRF